LEFAIEPVAKVLLNLPPAGNRFWLCRVSGRWRFFESSTFRRSTRIRAFKYFS